MYDRILVPVALDHPEVAEHSISVAEKLLNTGGQITVLHVVEDIPSFAEAYIPDGTIAANEAHATEVLERLVSTHPAVSEHAITHGKPGPGILSLAERNGSDLIVIASHKPGLEDYFIGSTASRVVRHARCCVHVLR